MTNPRVALEFARRRGMDFVFRAALRGGAMSASIDFMEELEFTAAIWLGLEDYALEHAREDEMRITVFTGPFLKSNDPIRFGVKVPVRFWKTIAFIHDETGELCATGYTMTQEGVHPGGRIRVRAARNGAGVHRRD